MDRMGCGLVITGTFPNCYNIEIMKKMMHHPKEAPSYFTKHQILSRVFVLLSAVSHVKARLALA